MNDFDYDIVQKKRVARGAFAHVNRKRGKCRLPSDYLTAAQKREMNGKMKTYNATRPMPWEDFKAMPDDIKREYLRNMQSCGGAATYLAEEMGCCSATIIECGKKLGVPFGEVVGTLTCGKRNYQSGTHPKWWKKRQKNSPMDQRRCEVQDRCTCEVQNCFTHG